MGIFEIGSTVYIHFQHVMGFKHVPYRATVLGYDSDDNSYIVEYEDDYDFKKARIPKQNVYRLLLDIEGFFIELEGGYYQKLSRGRG